jgi:hypothetical protein
MNSYLLVGMMQSDQMFCSSFPTVADTMTEELAFELMSQHMKGPPEQILVVQDDEVIAHYTYGEDPGEDVVFIVVEEEDL